MVGWVSGSIGSNGQRRYTTQKLDLRDTLPFCLKDSHHYRDTPPMGWCVGGLVGQWMGSGQTDLNKSVYVIEIIRST